MKLPKDVDRTRLEVRGARGGVLPLGALRGLPTLIARVSPPGRCRVGRPGEGSVPRTHAASWRDTRAGLLPSKGGQRRPSEAQLFVVGQERWEQRLTRHTVSPPRRESGNRPGHSLPGSRIAH